jgi:hypothetical protein
MEHLFVISQPSYFTHPGIGNVYTHCQTDKCKTKGTMTQVTKKETFTQPLTKASSIITGEVPVIKKQHCHNDQRTHENTASGCSDLQQQQQQPQQESKSPVTEGKSPSTSSIPFPPLVPSASLDSSDYGHRVKPSHTSTALPAQVADDLVTKTHKRVQHVLQKSPFLAAHQDAITKVPEFSLMDDDLGISGDIVRGDLLGQGGFASVYAVDIKTPERLCHYSQGKRYVVKHLHAKLYDSTSTTTCASVVRKLHLGTKDIVIESQYLAALSHPNIISLAGISSGGLDAFQVMRTL